MKNQFLLLISLFTCTLVFSQNPTVSISCGSSNCYSTDPAPISSSYSATIADGAYTTSNGWARAIQWNPTLNTFCCRSGDGTTFFSLQWNNAPNSPTRTIKVTVTYTKSGQPNKIVSDEDVVVVKHIGSITSMTIPGASPSSPSNGGTTLLPCGTSGLTISVPTPTTDPGVGVSYVWSLPNGWTGSSTTNSISVTPNSGANDGVISVSAKRTDGNVARSYSVNITRPRVTDAIITSVSWSPDDKPLCNSETRQLSGTSTTNATIYSWSTTGGTAITGASNQSIVTVSGSSNGTLTLVASNACGVSKNRTWNIYANVPQVAGSEVLVDGHPNYYPNYTSGSSYISVQGGGSCQSYKWELFGGSGYFYPGYCSCGYSYNGITFDNCNSGNASTSSSMAIRIRTANRCGQGNDVIIPLQVSGGGGYYRMSSPNPATTTISIELDKEKASSLNSLNLISATRSKVARSFDVGNAKSTNYFKTSNVVSFDVSNLDRGLYYVVLNFGENNQSFSELVMLH